LDEVRPDFLRLTRPYRPTYAAYLQQALNTALPGILLEQARPTIKWLTTQDENDLRQSAVWRTMQASVADQESQRQLMRVSDTCYYLAQAEALETPIFSASPDVASVVEAVVGESVQEVVETGTLVESAVSKFPASLVDDFSFQEIALWRRDDAFKNLRIELGKLAGRNNSADAVAKAFTECVEPLRQLADARSTAARTVLLDTFRAKTNQSNTQMLIELLRASSTGVIIGHFLSFTNAIHEPSTVAIVAGTVSLGLLWPKIKANDIVNTNYYLAERFAQRKKQQKDVAPQRSDDSGIVS